jgi:chromate reductase
MDKIKVLGIAGSLRKNSFNKELLRCAAEEAGEGIDLEIFDLEGIPTFNQDHENEPTEKVREFKAKIKSADAILIATPEYNYSIPGPLKNAIDCASRPSGDNAWNDKPVAIMSAAGGYLGGSRAQYHLRQTFVYLNMHPINKPEVIVPFFNDKIDSEGRLIDKHTRDKVRELLNALYLWTIKLTK